MQYPGPGEDLGVVRQGVGLLAQIGSVPSILEQRSFHMDKIVILGEPKPHIIVMRLPVGRVERADAHEGRTEHDDGRAVDATTLEQSVYGGIAIGEGG